MENVLSPWEEVEKNILSPREEKCPEAHDEKNIKGPESRGRNTQSPGARPKIERPRPRTRPRIGHG